MTGVDASAVADITDTSTPIAIFAAKADVNFTHCSAVASSEVADDLTVIVDIILIIETQLHYSTIKVKDKGEKVVG